MTFADFWSWAYSDTLSNGNRSVFAEFLVGRALDVLDIPRIEWNQCDFVYQGKRIEVKASAYVQSWEQKGPSIISFDIGPHRGWDAETNSNCPEPTRCADVYVFCLFTDRDKDNCDVTDPARWRFYVVAGSELDRHFGAQKRAGLSSIAKVATPVSFDAICAEVNRLLVSPSIGQPLAL